MSDVNCSSNFLNDPKVRNLIKESPLFLDAEDEEDVRAFRKLLEVSLSQGRWWGEMARIS